MVKIEIVESLFEKIEKTFKKDTSKIFDLLETTIANPSKGKLLGNVGGILIKELKFRNFRIYFLIDSYKLKFMDAEELTEILIKIVRMSNKKYQQKTIDEIKEVLLRLGSLGFE